MDNKSYSIVENGIVILTNAAGINLYETSKNLILENSLNIDAAVEVINQSKKYRAVFNLLPNDFSTQLIEKMCSWENVLNIYCLSLSYISDFSISLRELYIAKNKSEQTFYVKSVYVDLYRFLERNNNDLGIIRTIALEADLMGQFKSFTKEISVFRETYYAKIKEGRNSYYAHFNDIKDYREYYNYILKVDVEVESQMCINFSRISRLLLDLLKEIIQYILSKFEELNIIIAKEALGKKNELIAKIEQLQKIIPSEQYERIKLDIDNILNENR
ncbi:hypothetical protein [Bacteroides graminisolvens]|uniref:hypothetical protein n=1 Tax=Bacteroides graminisolvens TaxID=477666 RepID=UPI0029C6B0D7|nr:hypothetical protein [Bacteroides graminisolvens]